MKIVIERVSKADSETTAKIAGLLPALTTTGPAVTKELLELLIQYNCNYLFVAKVEGEIVGMLCLITFQLPSGLRVRIEDVVTDSPWEGKGIGTALNKHAIRIAQKLGAKSIDLTSRNAGPFYEKLGFKRRDTGVYRYVP